MTQENTVTIRLEYPVQLADRRLTEITMRRMLVRDMLQCPIKSMQDVEGELNLVARLCGLVPDELYTLDMADYARLQDTLISFRGSGNSAGERSDARLPAAGTSERHDHAGSAGFAV